MRLGRVVVAGDSMRPVLWPGDWLLVRRPPRLGAGRTVVVARRPDRPRTADRQAPGVPQFGWLVASRGQCERQRRFQVVRRGTARHDRRRGAVALRPTITQDRSCDTIMRH